MDARAYLAGLVGESILTVTGRRNRILEVGVDSVLVATDRSPSGRPVPIRWVQFALDELEAKGEIEISVESVGYRSAFIGAVLLTLHGARVLPSSPPRIVLRERNE